MNFYPAEYGELEAFPSSADFFLGFISPRFGLGIRSLSSFASGDRVAVICGERVSSVRLHTLQIGAHEHLYDPYFAGYLLHSCEPNLRLNIETLELSALRPIAAGDLLSLDYDHTEDTLYRSFRCECGASSCRGVISGRLKPRSAARPAAPAVTVPLANGFETELDYQGGTLRLSGKPLSEFVTHERIPTFVYSAAAFTNNLRRLERAMGEGGFAGRFRIFFALKANRHVGLLRELAAMTAGSRPLGVDACSVPEVRLAIANGVRPCNISLTACGLTRREVKKVLAEEELAINCDSLSMLEWIGGLAPGKKVGIRINPELGLGGNDKLNYAGTRNSKFGIYPSDFPRAKAIARSHDLRIVRLHCHAGCGVLDEQLDAYREVLRRLARYSGEFEDVRSVNIGGGLGVPLTPADTTLSLDRWVEMLSESFGHRAVDIELEPGNYLIKNAGVLLLAVACEEIKGGRRFVFLNGGFNLAPEPAFYDQPYAILPIDDRRDDPPSACTVAGNINEALDIWLQDAMLPAMVPDSVVVLMNAGAYAASMASNHCMRGEFREHLIPWRPA